MKIHNIIELNGPLNEEELEKEISREMRSGDLCFSRILYIFPDFITKSQKYVSGECRFSRAITKVVVKWNKEKNKKLNEDFNFIIPKAILEIYEFKQLLEDMLKNPTSDYSGFKNRISALSFLNYKKISEICGTFSSKQEGDQSYFNFSKLINRDVNFKTRFTKYLNGKMDLHSLIRDEIKPQYIFMKKFCEKLSKFSLDQFCIFIISNDIKPAKKLKMPPKEEKPIKIGNFTIY